MNWETDMFWNGAPDAGLVLRNHIHLGAEQLSVQGQATVWERK